MSQKYYTSLKAKKKKTWGNWCRYTLYSTTAYNHPLQMQAALCLCVVCLAVSSFSPFPRLSRHALLE